MLLVGHKKFMWWKNVWFVIGPKTTDKNNGVIPWNRANKEEILCLTF